jgi:hypothetical protein
MIEVLKQALEALKDVGVLTDREWQAVHKNKANELRQAIAELESQEPVAWVAEDVCEGQYIDGRPRKIWWECNKGVGMAFYTHPPQRTEPPDWFPAVENILNEYGLQAIDFVADFKAAMKDAEQSQRTEPKVCCQQYETCLEPCTPRGRHLAQRTWVGLAKEDRLCAKYMQDAPDGIEAVIDYIESKLKELNT